jgi:hypothetical protein
MLALCLAISANSAVAAGDAIGVVKIARGDTIVERAGERSAIVSGDSVYVDDMVETGEDGTLGITFKDNTRVSLGPNSQLAVNEFVYAPAEEEYSFVTRLTRGTLFFISGVIAKLAPETVSIETPSASIGVRGTRFLVRVSGETR